MIDTLPLSRAVIDYVNLAPGVTQSVALGGSSFANPITLDGASGNEPGWGTPTTPLTRTWIEEIQILGPGAEAQHGEFTGVMLNAVTRSGTNRFSGLGEYWTTRQSWTDNNRGDLLDALAAQFRPLEVLERWEGIGQVGGPVLRDRLWFFAGSQQYRNDARTAAFSTKPRTPNEPFSSLTERRAIGKLTTALPAGIRMEGFLARNLTDASRLNAGPLVEPEATTSTDRTDDIWNVRMIWAPSARWLVDARHGGNDRDSVFGPTTDRRNGPPPHLDLLTDMQSANALTYTDWNSWITTTTAAVTHYVDRGIGLSHEVKAGVEYERAALVDSTGFPGGRAYYDYDGQPYEARLWDGATYRGRHSRTTLYVQDSWSVSVPVTINAGLRFDRYHAFPPYEARYRTHSLAPRVGVAWDIGRGHDTVFRAHYGRYHDPIVTSYYDFHDPLADTPFIAAEVVGPEEFRELYRFLPTTGFAIDPDIKSSYAEESLIGIERALRAGFAIKAQYVYRSFEDTASFIDTATIWAPLQLPDPGPDGVVGTGDDAGLVTVYNNMNPGAAFRVLTNPPQAYRHYHALQLVATRRAARGAAVQASYTWSRTRGNFNNAFSSNAANNDNSINGVFVNPNRAINSEGRTAFDFTHALKAFGVWQLPKRWTLSGVYSYESGKPWARVVTFTSGLNQGFEAVRVEPLGRTLPAVNTVDIRVEKTVRIRNRTTVGLYGDVFNVANAGVARAYAARSGPRFGLPTAWLDPRTLSLGLRLMF